MRDRVKRAVLRRIRRRYGLLPIRLRPTLGLNPYAEPPASCWARLRYLLRVAVEQLDCWLYDRAYPVRRREEDILAARWSYPPTGRTPDVAPSENVGVATPGNPG